MELEELFGRGLLMPIPRRESTAERVHVGVEMVQASIRGLEWYKPVMGEVPLKILFDLFSFWFS